MGEDKELKTTPRFKVSRQRDMEKLGDSEGLGLSKLKDSDGCLK